MTAIKELLQYNFRELIHYEIMGKITKTGETPFGTPEYLEQRKPKENATLLKKAIYNLNFRLQQAWLHGEFDSEKNRHASLPEKQGMQPMHSMMTITVQNASIEGQIKKLCFDDLVALFLKRQNSLFEGLEFLKGKDEVNDWINNPQNKDLFSDLLIIFNEINKKRMMPISWKIGEAIVTVAIAAGASIGFIYAFGPAFLGGALLHFVTPAMAPLVTKPIATFLPMTLLFFGGEEILKRCLPSQEKQLRNAYDESIKQRQSMS